MKKISIILFMSLSITACGQEDLNIESTNTTPVIEDIAAEVDAEFSQELIIDEQVTIGNLLFKNSDFEEGNLTNWQATGDAYEYQPTFGDNPTARKRKMPANNQGDYWIGTYEKYQGLSGQRAGNVVGDKAKGTLISTEFEIKDEVIVFLIGGGTNKEGVYVALEIDGKEIYRTAGAKAEETMREAVWDVSEYIGETAVIKIVDELTVSWGHINVDYFHYQE